MSTPYTIGFAGLSHLGLVSSAAAAAKGFAVVAHDGDAAIVDAVSAGRLPIFEPGLAELIAGHRARLRYTADIAALGACDLVYVATDVPTDARGTSDLSSIDALVARLLPVLRADAVLVVLCQVPPGFTRRVALPPERLFYQVETLVFGDAVARARHPERFILGCADPARPLPPALAAHLQAYGCPVLPMRYESAELAKIAINCCLAASITVANSLAELSERLGADWSEIAGSLRLDRRIGPHAYLTAGLGIAGGNIERDLATVVRLAEAHGTDGQPIASAIANSRHRRDWVQRVLESEGVLDDTGRVVAMLGLAYKENTRSIKNSPALAVLGRLTGHAVRLFDPEVPAAESGHSRVVAARDALDALDGADVLALMTPWPAFREISAEAVAARLRGRLVVDPYRLLDGPALRRLGFRYHAIGMAPLL